VLGVHLNEGAREGFPQRLGRTLALAFETAEAFSAGFGKEEVMLFEETAEGGRREADAVALFKQDGEFVLAPGGEALAQGHHLIHRGLRQGGGADAAGASGAVFERGQVLGVEAVKPLVEGAWGDGKVAAGKACVLAVSVVEVEPVEAALGIPGKGVAQVQPIKGSG
jgi:hypothetical protein